MMVNIERDGKWRTEIIVNHRLEKHGNDENAKIVKENECPKGEKDKEKDSWIIIQKFQKRRTY